MRVLLDQLLSEVRRVNPKSAESLRPGLPRDLVVEKLSALPYEISPDAVALYEWADGSDDTFELLPGGYFVPLQHALTEFWIVHGMRDQLEEIFHQPYRDCFRFLSDGSDGGYAIGRLDSPSEGQIISLCIHAPWQTAFASLERLLATAIESYRRGVFASNDSDILDFKLYRRIAAELNPGFKLWHMYDKG